MFNTDEEWIERIEWLASQSIEEALSHVDLKAIQDRFNELVSQSLGKSND